MKISSLVIHLKMSRGADACELLVHEVVSSRVLGMC